MIGDEQVEFNPFVYLNSYKMKEIFSKDGEVRIEKEFSLFNKRYVYPFEPVPNALRIKPPSSTS